MNWHLKFLIVVMRIMTNYLIITALYRFICLAYLILCLAIRSRNKMMHLTSINESSPPKSSVKLIHYFMSMLMWPILGTINFMLPTLTTYKGGEVHEVALLDSVLGIGMAIIGVLFSKFILSKWMHLLFILSIVITISWYVLEDILLFKLVLMLLFGLTFGGARIIFRKMIVTAYASHTVKHIYSLGNALGLPILALCIYLSILNLNFVWLPSFILLIVLLFLLKIGHHERISSHEKSPN